MHIAVLDRSILGKEFNRWTIIDYAGSNKLDVIRMLRKWNKVLNWGVLNAT